MQRYGRVYTGYWTSPDIIGLPVETKCVGAYLLSCHHGNMIGCFRLPAAYVVEDLRMSSGTVSEGFRNLCEKGFLTYDSDLSWVLIRRFLKWNPLENPNQGKAAAKLVEQVPQNSSVYADLLQMLQAYPANFPDGFVNRLGTAAEPFRNPHPHPHPHPHPELQDDLVQLASEVGPNPYTAIIDQAFALYCSLIGRDPRRYTLTKPRREKATARLKEREHINSSLEAAAIDLETAIRNLAASEYHRAGGYIDWLQQIFKSQEEFEKRLNWTAPKEATNGAHHSESAGIARAERSDENWVTAAAERKSVRSLERDVPANGGLLSTPGTVSRDSEGILI